MKTLILGLLVGLPMISFCQTTYSPVGSSATFGDIMKSYGQSPQLAYHAISIKEGTVGYPYVMTDWSAGTVMFNGQEIKETSKTLNFDKIKGVLLYKKDENTVLEIEMNKVQSFVLNDPFGAQTFINGTAFGETGFLKEVFTSNDYHLYKATKCTFKPANFKSSGVFTTGNDYDEYVDENRYVIITPKNEITKLETLNNKEMKNLAAEFPEAASFIKSNMGTSNKEVFLTQLVTTLSSGTQATN